MTARFSAGLVKLAYETIAGAHPVVPLMVRDTGRTQALVQHRGLEATLSMTSRTMCSA
jgi:glycine C-acetyltransferase